jgi:hypothetical protein
MSLFDDLENEMEHVPLDPETAERILAGTMAPEDAPPTYADVVRLLENASSETALVELPGETEIVAAIAAAVRASSANQPLEDRRKFRMTSTFTRPKLAAAFLAATLAATSGLALAGSLPGAAQGVASTVLAALGVEVPGPDENAGDNPNVRPASPPAASDGSAVCAAASGGICTEAQTSPQTLAEAARSTKGMAICIPASSGACEARNGGGGGDEAGPPVPAQNAGGTGTADTASGGASSDGTSTANSASGGASSAGSGNADSAPAGGGGSGIADDASGGASSSGTGTAGSASDGASDGVSNVPPVPEAPPGP